MRRLVSTATAGAATLATLTLVAGPASADPMVSDDNVTVRAGDYGQFAVAANDNGPEKLKITSNPTTGWASFGDNQVLTYVAPRSFSGTVTLEYAAFDPDVADDENDPSAGQIGAPATVTIEVSPIGALTAATDTLHAFVGETVEVDLGANDTNGASSDVFVVGPDDLSSTLGSLSVGGGGRGTLTGETAGHETIDYQVLDGVDRTEIGHGSLIITVDDRDVSPAPDQDTTPANEEITIDVLENDGGVLAGDTVEITSPPEIGDYAFFDSGVRQVRYSSSTTGHDTFGYTIYGTDGAELGTGTVSVDVTAALAVSAHDDEYDAEKDTANILPVTDNDRSDNPVTLTILTGPAHGAATVLPDDYSSQIRYTPVTGYDGGDSLTYKLDDHLGHTSTATVTLHVKQVGVQDLDSSVRWQGAHLTWTNPRATTFTGVVVRQSEGATADDYPEPPATVEDGTDVPVTTGATSVDVSTLSNGHHYAFSVFAVYGDQVSSEPRTTYVNPGVEPVANLHADGGNAKVTLAWTNPTGVESVTLAYSTDGFETQHPVTVPANAAGVVVSGLVNGTSYDFQAVSHGDGTESNVAHTSATPRATNTGPKAVADTVSLNGAQPVTVWVDTNDSDPNGDELQVISYTQPAHGSVTCTLYAICTYTPQSADDPSETDTFTYTLSDGHGGRSPAVVTLLRRHFVADADTMEATSVAYSQFDVLGNDTGYRDSDRLVVDSDGFTLGTLGIAFGGDEKQLVEFEPNGTAGTQVVGYTLFDENDVLLGHAELTVNVTLAPQVTMAANHPVSSVNAAVTFSGRTTPARAGAPIRLERYSSGAWRVVQSKTIAAASTATDVRLGSPYSFAVRERTSGFFDYRVVVPADSGRALSVANLEPIAMYSGALGTVVKTRNEYVLVKNTSRFSVNLKAWTITTRAGKKLTLPSKALAAGRWVRVHPGTGRSTSTDLYLRRGASFGNTHDTLTLRDTRRVVVASKRY